MYRTRTLRLAMLACCATGAFAVSHATLAGDAKKIATHVKFPVIPPEAKAKHLSGSGVILVHVRPDGTVERAEVAVVRSQDSGRRSTRGLLSMAVHTWKTQQSDNPVYVYREL